MSHNKITIEKVLTGKRFMVKESDGFPDSPKHPGIALVQERMIGREEQRGYWRDPISQVLYKNVHPLR